MLFFLHLSGGVNALFANRNFRNLFLNFYTVALRIIQLVLKVNITKEDILQAVQYFD